MEGTVEEIEPILHQLTELLRQISGDPKLSIKRVFPGSTILELECINKAGLELRDLIAKGKLREILGSRVYSITPAQRLVDEGAEKHELKHILGQHSIFRHLPPGDLEALSRLAARKTYKAGQSVFLKGDPGSAMMAVLSGCVRIGSTSSEGREVVLNVISAGEVFGEIAMIDGDERTADANAMEPTELLVLNRRDFMPVLARNPKLLELLSRRLRRTSEQMEHINFLDLSSKLAKRLLYLADHYGEPGGEPNRRNIRISQQSLANMIGASREAVNMQLVAWKEEGLISSRRGWITILDRERLDQIIEEPGRNFLQGE